MNTAEILSTLTEAISNVTGTVELIHDMYETAPDNSYMYILKPTESLLLSGTMTVVRNLWDALPEEVKAMATDEESEVINRNFWKHKFTDMDADDRTLDWKAVRDASHTVHHLCYRLYNMGKAFQ